MSESAIKATQLQKTYRIPVREPGVGNALRALFHPANQDVPAVTGIDFEIDRGNAPSASLPMSCFTSPPCFFWMNRPLAWMCPSKSGCARS
jgi:hypothetical protein